MELKQSYSEEELASIHKAYKKEQELYKKKFRDLNDPPPPNPLKSAKMLADEQDAKVEELMHFLQKDLKQGAEFYLSTYDPQAKERIIEIFNKIKSRVNVYIDNKAYDPVTDEDCEFLENLAKDRLIRGEFEQASCMFRFLIHLNQFFSGAWVGWAMCEQEQNHIEMVDFIYQMACEILPLDYYIYLFAADFYSSKDKKKAKTLLEKAKAQLEEDCMESSKTYEEILFLISKL